MASPGEVVFGPLELAPDLQVHGFTRLGRLELSQGAFVDASGNGGGSVLMRSGRLRVDGSSIFADNTGPIHGAGLGLDLQIGADAVLTNGARLTTDSLGAGHARDLRLTAGSLSVDQAVIASNPNSSGHGGNLGVHAGTLTLTGGAFIDSGTRGSGRGGTLTVAATDAISIAGQDSRNNAPSGLFSQATGSGNAGRLFVSAPTLSMKNSQILANTTGAGGGGDLALQVGRLALSDGAQISSGSFATGRGGNVTIVATEQLDLSTGGTISASSSGKGDAGSIVIQAGNIFRSQNGAVTTEAEQADGGNIQLTVGTLVDLRDSQLTATVKSGQGKGGNITIDPRFVILAGSQIRADAFGGPGGNVRIVSDVFLRDPASLVSASSALGVQGTVDIRSPVTSLSGVVAPLPQAFVSAAALLPARCAARLSGGRYSSLVVGGPEGLPLDPGGLLPSILTLDGSVGDPAVDATPHQRKTHTKFALLAVAEVSPEVHPLMGAFADTSWPPAGEERDMTMRSQVVMQLFSAEEWKTGKHKRFFLALRATRVLLGVVGLSGMCSARGGHTPRSPGRPTTSGCRSASGNHHRCCTPAPASLRLPYEWMSADHTRA